MRVTAGQPQKRRGKRPSDVAAVRGTPERAETDSGVRFETGPRARVRQKGSGGERCYVLG